MIIEMSSSTAFQINEPLRSPPELLRLTNWPLRNGGLSAWGTLLVVVTVGFSVAWAANSNAAGVLSFFVLCLTMWRLWIPVTFEVGPRGIIEIVFRRRRMISWRLIARYEIRRHGVLLFAEASPSGLAVLRSTYIRWDKQRDKLLETLQYYLSSRSPQ